jgi:hypothetical protein
MEVTSITSSCNGFSQKVDFKQTTLYHIANNKSINISDENGKIGRIFINENNEIDFEGNFTDSAKIFIQYLQNAWK